MEEATCRNLSGNVKTSKAEKWLTDCTELVYVDIVSVPLQYPRHALGVQSRHMNISMHIRTAEFSLNSESHVMQRLINALQNASCCSFCDRVSKTIKLECSHCPGIKQRCINSKSVFHRDKHVLSDTRTHINTYTHTYKQEKSEKWGF